MNGHAAGDELLAGWSRASAAPCARWTRSGAWAGTSSRSWRPGAGESGAEQIATRARKLLSERVAVSTGRGLLSRPRVDHDELQRHADRQLYANKHGDVGPLHRRPPRADLGRDAGARGRRAHGHPDRALDDRGALRRRDRRSGSAGAAPDLAHLRIAAMLHDIGKVVLPDRILQKPDSLDDLRVRGGQAPSRGRAPS